MAGGHSYALLACRVSNPFPQKLAAGVVPPWEKALEEKGAVFVARPVDGTAEKFLPSVPSMGPWRR